jgi:predicted DNA-binding transcriptional regulator YafY
MSVALTFDIRRLMTLALATIISQNGDSFRRQFEEKIVSRTARLLELLITLRTEPRFTVQELADEFGVSRRTMLRDLHALSEMGVPLAASPGPGGGYGLIVRKGLLPLSLTADEAIGIVLSYEAFLQYAASPFDVQSLSAVTKLRNAMSPEVVAQLDRIHEHVAIQDPEQRYEAPHLAALLAASVDEVHLRIVYESMSGVAQRVIFPRGVFAWQGLWYVACHDYRRGGEVMLRADRVQALEPVPDREPPPSIPLREWLRTLRSGAVDMVRVRATVSDRGAKMLELTTLFGPVDGNIIESMIPISEIDYYARHLLVVGIELTVHEPAALVEAMRAHAAAIATGYDSR